MTTQEMITNTQHNLSTLIGMKQSLLNDGSSWGSVVKVQNEITLQLKHLENLQATLKAEQTAVQEGV